MSRLFDQARQRHATLYAGIDRQIDRLLDQLTELDTRLRSSSGTHARVETELDAIRREFISRIQALVPGHIALELYRSVEQKADADCS